MGTPIPVCRRTPHPAAIPDLRAVARRSPVATREPRVAVPLCPAGILVASLGRIPVGSPVGILDARTAGVLPLPVELQQVVLPQVAQQPPGILLRPDADVSSAGPATSPGSSPSRCRRRNAPGTRHAMRVETPAIRRTPVTPEPDSAAIPREPVDRRPATATPTGSPSTVVVHGIASEHLPGRRAVAVPPAHPGGSGSGRCGSSAFCSSWSSRWA